MFFCTNENCNTIYEDNEISLEQSIDGLCPLCGEETLDYKEV